MRRIIKVVLVTLASVAATVALVVAGFVVWYQVSFYTGTIYADDFSTKKWNSITIGMPKDEVLKIIGQPLNYQVDWNRDKGEEDIERLLWTRAKEGFGFFHCLYFRNGVVVKKINFRDD